MTGSYTRCLAKHAHWVNYILLVVGAVVWGGIISPIIVNVNSGGDNLFMQWNQLYPNL